MDDEKTVIDAAGNLASMTSGDGNVSVSYTWDSLNRLSTMTDNRLTDSNNTTTYTYDTANNVVKVAYPNGVQATLNYDTLNRLTSLTTPQTGYLYQLGPTGTRSNVTELTGRSINWSYDGIYRLTGETISNAPSKVNGSVAYGLDLVRNRLSTTSTIAGINSGALSFNPDDQELIESYDTDGNTTATGGKSFAYDSDDHLKSMNGGAVTITYDGDGNRVQKIANGVVTRYLVDDLNPTGYPQVVEETASVPRTYTYGLQRIDENQVINGVQTPSFYGYDGMGSVRQLTNSAGAITDIYEYDAYGNKIASTGTTPNNYLYRGEQWDPDLSLYYLRARYYNPVMGRFMSRDPNGAANQLVMHPYLYTGSNPVNYVDPRGEAELFSYAIRSNAAFTEVQLVRIYGCVANAGFAAASLILSDSVNSDVLIGAAGATFGCVTISAPVTSEFKAANLFLKLIPTANYGFCGASIKAVVDDLTDLARGKGNSAGAIVDSLGSLAGCVTTRLGTLVEAEE